MAYIKGIFIQEIFSNQSNGYMVGLMRVKESDISEYNGKVVTFTGIFDELKYKTTYKMNGKFDNHNKYGMQFNVQGYEVVLPTDEEEIIEFLASSLFPIGESIATKIVNKLGKNAINIIIPILLHFIKNSYNSLSFACIIAPKYPKRGNIQHNTFNAV